MAGSASCSGSAAVDTASPLETGSGSDTGSGDSPDSGSSRTITGAEDVLSVTPLTVFSTCRAGSTLLTAGGSSVKFTTLSYVTHAAAPTASRETPSAK